jgi:hypothetical protein
MTSDHDLARRRRVRRTALILGCVAVAFYVGFIVMAVLRAELGARHPARPAPTAALR